MVLLNTCWWATGGGWPQLTSSHVGTPFIFKQTTDLFIRTDQNQRNNSFSCCWADETSHLYLLTHALTILCGPVRLFVCWTWFGFIFTYFKSINVKQSKLLFSSLWPSFLSLFTGGQWRTFPDPLREMRFPASPWKPWIQSSQSTCGNRELFHHTKCQCDLKIKQGRLCLCGASVHRDPTRVKVHAVLMFVLTSQWREWKSTISWRLRASWGRNTHSFSVQNKTNIALTDTFHQIRSGSS